MSSVSRRLLGGVILLLGSGLMSLLILRDYSAKQVVSSPENYDQLVPETDSQQVALPDESFQPLAAEAAMEQQLLTAENAELEAQTAAREADLQKLIETQALANQQAIPSQPAVATAPLADQAQTAAAETAAAVAVAEVVAKPAGKPAEINVETKPEKSWMVQVALTPDEAAAKKIAAKLKEKGIKATLSKTSKGVRVLAGDEANKASAEKIRKQVTDIEPSAWVIHWEPVN